MSAPLRVLHVGKYYPPYRGGMETHLEALCRRLAETGEVHVRAIVANDGPRTVRETIDGVEVVRVGTMRKVASATLNPRMAREIRDFPADVVHLHHPNPTGMLSWLASRHPGRLFVTYHSDIVRQRVLGAAFAPVLHHVLGRAEAILASSPDYAASSPVLRRHAERTVVVPFGIDPAGYETGEEDVVDALRARFGPRMVLAVGRLVYYKGFQYLVQAMDGLDGHLVLVGDGPDGPALRRLAGEAGVAERVTFEGPVGDLRPYYRAARVFCLPAVERSEAFGLVQLEAMAAGAPVVNTALDSGVPFVSAHGESGLTVPPRDAGALRAALARLLDDPALHAALSAGARRRVRERFSEDRMVSDTLRLYRRAAPGPPRPAGRAEPTPR